MDVELPWARSLKEKRSAILLVTEKLKSRFPVSIARLDGLDSHSWERIGVSAISNDRVWLEKVLSEIRNFVAGSSVTLSKSHLDIEVWDAWQPDYYPDTRL